MPEESILSNAVDTAWAVYLAAHSDVDPADGRRCSLARHLSSRWAAGEHEAEELICSGLAYLDRRPAEVW
jgi:hypothetical protein